LSRGQAGNAHVRRHRAGAASTFACALPFAPERPAIDGALAVAIDAEAAAWASFFDVTDEAGIEGRRQLMRANAHVGYLAPLVPFLPAPFGNGGRIETSGDSDALRATAVEDNRPKLEGGFQ